MIRALTYLRIEVNVDPGLLRVHGVNMSLGCAWRPDQYAAGQSPLCQAVNQLVGAGVVVVVSAGNYGARSAAGDGANTSAIMAPSRNRLMPRTASRWDRRIGKPRMSSVSAGLPARDRPWMDG